MSGVDKKFVFAVGRLSANERDLLLTNCEIFLQHLVSGYILQLFCSYIQNESFIALTKPVIL